MTSVTGQPITVVITGRLNGAIVATYTVQLTPIFPQLPVDLSQFKGLDDVAFVPSSAAGSGIYSVATTQFAIDNLGFVNHPAPATPTPPAGPTPTAATPTAGPSAPPTAASPTAGPTAASPAAGPTAASPTAGPTAAPPTAAPTPASPTVAPSAAPTAAPTSAQPPAAPSAQPSPGPTAAPSSAPSAAPTSPPTAAPTGPPAAPPLPGLTFDGIPAGSVPDGYGSIAAGAAFGGFVAVDAASLASKYHVAMVSATQVRLPPQKTDQMSKTGLHAVALHAAQALRYSLAWTDGRCRYAKMPSRLSTLVSIVGR